MSAESDDLDKSTIHEDIVTLFKDRSNKSLSIQLQPVKVLAIERLVSPTLFSRLLIVRKVRWMGPGEARCSEYCTDNGSGNNAQWAMPSTSTSHHSDHLLSVNWVDYFSHPRMYALWANQRAIHRLCKG